jgi:hypothetical protein
MYASYDPGQVIYDPLIKKVPKLVPKIEQVRSQRDAVMNLALDFGTSMQSIYTDLLSLRNFSDSSRIFLDGERKMHVGILLVFVALLYLFCSL